MLLLLAYCYYLVAGPGDALAQIGLLAFVAAAQFAPAIVAAVYWRGARRAAGTRSPSRSRPFPTPCASSPSHLAPT